MFTEGFEPSGTAASAPFAGRTHDAPERDGWPSSDGAVPSLTSWTDDDVLAAMVEAEAQARRADAWRVCLAAEISDRSSRSLGPEGLAARRGCRTTRELIRRITGASDWAVARWLRIGRATTTGTGLSGQSIPPDFERVAAALDEHRLRLDSAARIIDALSPVRGVAGDGAVRAAEEELVRAAAADEPGGVPPLDADSVRVQAQTWATFLDQDGSAPPEADVARRALRLGGLHRGMVRISGLLLPEVAAALAAYADASTNPRTPEVPDPAGSGSNAPSDGHAPDGHASDRHASDGHAADVPDHRAQAQADADRATPSQSPLESADAGSSDRETERADVGDEHAVGHDPRTRPQLLHDILAAALGAAARVAGHRSVAGNSPTVLVAVRSDDLAGGRGTSAAFTGDTFGTPAPVSMAATRQLACDGVLQRVALDAAGAVTSLWSPQRCFTGNQRRAIALRDGGCVIPGCHVPAAWCEVHHVIPHVEQSNGTHTSNGVLLCWYHHRTIETSGWRIRFRSGLPEIQAPPWLRTLPRAKSVEQTGRLQREGPSAAEGRSWRPALGSPTRFLDALARRPAFVRLT